MLKKTLITISILFLVGILSVTIVILHKPSQNLIISAYNQVRFLSLVGGSSDCLDELTKRNVKYRFIGNMTDGICMVKNGVRVSSFSNTALNGAVTLSCPSAIKVDNWLIEIKAKYIEHNGSYNCRSQRNNNIISEHSFGNAIDIVSINGAVVASDWRKETPKGQILEHAHQAACDIFSNIIGPDDNSLHAEHFHLDTGWGFGCTLKPIKQLLLRELR